MDEDTSVDEQEVREEVEAAAEQPEASTDKKPEDQEDLTAEEQQIQDALAEFEGTKGELTENAGGLKLREDTEEETPEEDKETEIAEPEEEVPVEPVVEAPEPDESGIYSQTLVEDPGEFTPGDYGFEITLTDGKKYNVKTPEDAEAVADLVDENPELITAKMLIEFNRNVNKMDTGIERDKTAYDAQKQAYEAHQEQVQARDTTIMQINNGINYLQDKGLLPNVDPKLDSQDVRWEDHADEPGIKERLELLKYMSDENERRSKAGLEPSFDIVGAYNGMQLEKMRSQVTSEDKAEKTARRKAGSRVTGQSRSVNTVKRKNEIVGTGGSIDDVVNEMLYA